MKLKKIIAIFLFGFVTNLFANDCSDLLTDANPKNLSKVLSCGFNCQKDEDCEDATICQEVYTVNMKYTSTLKKYLSQFHNEDCTTSSNLIWSGMNDVCFEPKCVANKCLRKSLSCQLKRQRDQQTTNMRINSQPPPYGSPDSTFRRFEYVHYKRGQRCIIEENELSLYIKKSKIDVNSPVYKSSIILEFAKDQLKKKNNDDKIYCSATYFMNTPVRIANSNVPLKDAFPDFYKSTLSYMISLFSQNKIMMNEVFSNEMRSEWIMFLQVFNTELKFLEVIPAPLLKQIYGSRKYVTWNEGEANFYINHMLKKGIKSFGVFTMINWLEKNPQYYKKNVIPLFSSQDKTMNDSYDSKTFSDYFINKNLLMSNLDSFISIYMAKDESNVKCSTASQILKYYDASQEQNKLLTLENSQAPCVKKVFQNIKSLKRIDVNGCPSFSLSNLNISFEHFNELKKISDGCNSQCKTSNECSYVQKGCLDIIPVNLISKDSVIKNLGEKALVCETLKYTPPVQMECYNNNCRQTISQCEYDSFVANVQDFITKNDLDSCTVPEDCTTTNVSTSGLQQAQYPINKKFSFEGSVVKYVVTAAAQCESQGTPVWKAQSGPQIYRPSSNVCVNNKCIITSIGPGQR